MFTVEFLSHTGFEARTPLRLEHLVKLKIKRVFCVQGTHEWQLQLRLLHLRLNTISQAQPLLLIIPGKSLTVNPIKSLQCNHSRSYWLFNKSAPSSIWGWEAEAIARIAEAIVTKQCLLHYTLLRHAGAIQLIFCFDWQTPSVHSLYKIWVNNTISWWQWMSLLAYEGLPC